MLRGLRANVCAPFQVKWAVAGSHRCHTHDVKAVSASSQGLLASAGIDSEVCFVHIGDVASVSKAKKVCGEGGTEPWVGVVGVRFWPSDVRVEGVGRQR